MGLLPDVQNSGLRMRRECRERFSPPQRVSDPDMHHGTCVTHVPWCMPESLTCGFLWSRWRGKRSRHSRCVRNPQSVKGKALVTICFPLLDKFILAHTPAWLLVYLITARKYALCGAAKSNSPLVNFALLSINDHSVVSSKCFCWLIRYWLKVYFTLGYKINVVYRILPILLLNKKCRKCIH